MLLSSNVALIGGNSIKPGSSYYALIKAVLSLLQKNCPQLVETLLVLTKLGSSYYALIKAAFSLFDRSAQTPLGMVSYLEAFALIKAALSL